MDTPEAQSATISVEITAIPSVEGVVRIALFNKEEGFRDENFALRKELFPVKGNQATWEFRDVVPGKYAVAVYHDADNNGKLDTNFFGIPTDAYGFSNNAMGLFGPPDFEDASFVVAGGVRKISIKLH
ncbi:MAG: DUF2141 domain-containing protein [Bacteroidia bacterium]